MDDLLLYVDFYENEEDLPIIYMKDESVMVVFKLNGIDHEGIDEEEMDLYSHKIRMAVEQLNKGFTLTNYLLRTDIEIKGLKTSNDVPEIIQYVQNVNKKFWKNYSNKGLYNELYCSLSYKLPNRAQKHFNTLLQPNRIITLLEENLKKSADKLLEGYLSIKSSLERFGFKTITKNQTFKFLYKLLNDDTPPFYREDLPINTQLAHSSIRFKEKQRIIEVDERYFVTCVSFKYPPPSTAAFFMRRLYELPFKFIMKNTFRVINYEAFEKKITFNQNIAQAMSGRSKSAENYVDEVSEFQDKVNTEKETPMYWNCTLYLKSADIKQLQKNTYILTSLLKELGFQGKVEQKNYRNSYFSMLPGHERVNTRKTVIVGSNAGDVFSAYSLSAGSEEPMDFFIDRHKGVYGYNHFKKDLPAHHMIITGSTGTGKSVLACRMLLTSLIENPMVFVIDLSDSFNMIFELLKIQMPEDTAIMRVNAGKIDFKFNPFIPDQPENEEYPASEKQMTFCMNLLSIMIGKNLLHEGNKIVIRETLQQFFLQYAAILPKSEDPIPPLDIICRILQNYTDDPELPNALKLWTFDRKGEMFNSGIDNFKSRRLVLFDLKDIKEDEAELAAITYTVFNKIYKDISVKAIKDVKKYLYMDEAHRYLKIPQFAYWIEFFNRVGRHFNLKDVLISQGVSDIDKENESWSDGVFSNVKEAIFFGGQKNVAKSFKKLQMTDYHIQMYERMNKEKREFFYWDDNKTRRVFNATTSKRIVWLATSDPDESKVRNDIYEICGKDIVKTIETIVEVTEGCRGKEETLAKLREYTRKKNLEIA